MAVKTEKMPFFTIAGPKLTYVGKVPKINFEKFDTKNYQFWSLFGWKST